MMEKKTPKKPDAKKVVRPISFREIAQSKGGSLSLGVKTALHAGAQNHPFKDQSEIQGG